MRRARPKAGPFCLYDPPLESDSVTISSTSSKPVPLLTIRQIGFVSPNGIPTHLRPFPLVDFFKRTPGPPPFSSMNSAGIYEITSYDVESGSLRGSCVWHASQNKNLPTGQVALTARGHTPLGSYRTFSNSHRHGSDRPRLLDATGEIAQPRTMAAPSPRSAAARTTVKATFGRCGGPALSNGHSKSPEIPNNFESVRRITAAEYLG